MTEQIVQFTVTVAAIALGVMNYFRHRHLEHDMKQYPLTITMEISYDENLHPQPRITRVKRGKRGDKYADDSDE